MSDGELWNVFSSSCNCEIYASIICIQKNAVSLDIEVLALRKWKLWREWFSHNCHCLTPACVLSVPHWWLMWTRLLHQCVINWQDWQNIKLGLVLVLLTSQNLSNVLLILARTVTGTMIPSNMRITQQHQQTLQTLPSLRSQKNGSTSAFLAGKHCEGDNLRPSRRMPTGCRQLDLISQTHPRNSSVFRPWAGFGRILAIACATTEKHSYHNGTYWRMLAFSFLHISFIGTIASVVLSSSFIWKQPPGWPWANLGRCLHKETLMSTGKPA